MLSRPAFHAAEETRVEKHLHAKGKASHVLREKGTPATDFRIDPW
jgi:hypothetical protein